MENSKMITWQILLKIKKKTGKQNRRKESNVKYGALGQYFFI